MPAQVEKDEKEILNELFENQDSQEPVIFETEPKLDKEVERYFEKVEKEQYLSQPITDDYGQPLVSPPAPQEPQIILPISEQTFELGLKKKVSDSWRWLSEWCLRLVKIFGSKAVFRKAERS